MHALRFSGTGQGQSRISFSHLAVCLALAASTAIVYFPVRNFDFTSYDDPAYVTLNQHVRAGLTWPTVRWAFSSGESANWFPLTRLSHALDYQLFGGSGGATHIVNVVLHLFAALLLYGFLCRATRQLWPSAFAAFLFVLHPLHVGSVAWISERKDVLSAVFWFLTLWAWVRYAERPGWRRYLLALAAFGLGLMAKPMLVSLPFVLLLVDYWPLRRRLSRTLIFEKIPFLALSLAVSLVTFLVQRAGGALVVLERVRVATRIENALIQWIVYIGKTFWPVRLTVFYPYRENLPLAGALAAASILAALTVLAVCWIRKRPWFATGWLWYLITLVPVIGIVQVGAQARADRYMYIPMVGIGIILAWGGAELATRGRVLRTCIALSAAAACVAMTIDARYQLQFWKNSETLYRHALAVTTGNYMMCLNLGETIGENPARLREAIDVYRNCLRIKPDYAPTHENLGAAVERLPGHAQEAIREYQEALRLDPGSSNAHGNLGATYMLMGRPDEALPQLETALRINQDNTAAQRALGMLLSGMPGRLPEAAAHLEKAVELAPDDAQTQDNLGVTLGKLGRDDEALPHFEAAVKSNPHDAKAQANLAVALTRAPGRMNEAIEHFEESLRIHPDPALRQKVDALEASQR